MSRVLYKLRDELFMELGIKRGGPEGPAKTGLWDKDMSRVPLAALRRQLDKLCFKDNSRGAVLQERRLAEYGKFCRANNFAPRGQAMA